MGSIHHLIKFIPNLAEISKPIRPLLKKENVLASNKLKWEDKHTKTFKNIKSQIAKIVENKHFDVDMETRVKCDASKLGLGATLEQKTENIWHTIAFASRFLNTVEHRYSTNELELLAVVWSLEHFKHYLQGSEFTLQTDHQALLTALKENRGNKTYQSRLTRWVDRLLPFNFNIEHISVKQMGFADYFSRNPNGIAIQPSEEDPHFVINQIKDFKYTLIKNTLRNNTNNRPFHNDVTNRSLHKQTTTHAFCHSRPRKQSLNLKHNLNTQILHTDKINSIKPQPYSNNSSYKPLKIFKQFSTNYQSKNQFINVITRSRPQVDTFNRPVIRRHRAPNKKRTIPQNMENQTTRPPLVTISTQTEDSDNIGRGREPIQPALHPQKFPLSSNRERMPDYRKHLSRVFGEEFLAEATKQDRTLTPIIKTIKGKDWEALRKSNKYFYSLRKDLSVTNSGCMIYDIKLVIPRNIKQFVIDAIRQTHPGQAGMLSLGNLIWFPCIQRSLTSKAQACEECTKQGKNLNPLMSKQNLEEPNEELQMVFAVPIPFRNHVDNYYILVTVGRYSRFPTSRVYKNCDTSIAIEYLEEYCKFHGIPRSLRCDQAQAFNSRDFNVHCKDNNIKPILAPAGDHRATGMVERLIQTMKRKLGVMAIDPLWSSEDITTIVSNIIQNIRLIPNRITKITPFEAHFGRKPNTALSNIVTKPTKHNLSNKNIKNLASDCKLLKQPVLSPATIWDMEQDSEPELNIQ